MSNNQSRMAENYEIIASFQIGDKEVVFGRDLNCDKPYFCGLYSKEKTPWVYYDYDFYDLIYDNVQSQDGESIRK